MAKKTASDYSRTGQVNSFTGGLNTDLHPMVQPSDTLTDCLNGTLITYNGNENMLQNDMGNYALKNAKLPKGYIPVGMKEYGGIVYIASYNPFTKKAQLGSYPSPQTVFADAATVPEVEISEIQISTAEQKLTPEMIFSLLEESAPSYAYSSYAAQEELKVFTNNFNDSTITQLGDLYYLSKSEYNDDKTSEPFQVIEPVIIDVDKTVESTNVSLKDIPDKGINGPSGSDFKEVAWEKPGWLGIRNRVHSINNHSQHIIGNSPIITSSQAFGALTTDAVITDNRLEWSFTEQNQWTINYDNVFKHKPENELWVLPKNINTFPHSVITSGGIRNITTVEPSYTAVEFNESITTLGRNFLDYSTNPKHLFLPNTFSIAYNTMDKHKYNDVSYVYYANLPSEFWPGTASSESDLDLGKGTVTTIDVNMLGQVTYLYLPFYKLDAEAPWILNKGLTITNKWKVDYGSNTQYMTLHIKVLATESQLNANPNSTEDAIWKDNIVAIREHLANGIEGDWGRLDVKMELISINELDTKFDTEEYQLFSSAYDSNDVPRLLYEGDTSVLSKTNILPIIKDDLFIKYDLTNYKVGDKYDLTNSINWWVLLENSKWIVSHDNIEFPSGSGLSIQWTSFIWTFSEFTNTFLYWHVLEKNEKSAVDNFIDAVGGIGPAMTIQQTQGDYYSIQDWVLVVDGTTYKNLTPVTANRWLDPDSNLVLAEYSLGLELPENNTWNRNKARWDLSQSKLKAFKVVNGIPVSYKEFNYLWVLNNQGNEKTVKSEDDSTGYYISDAESLQLLATSAVPPALSIMSTINYDFQLQDGEQLGVAYRIEQEGTNNTHYLPAQETLTQPNKKVFQGLYDQPLGISTQRLYIKGVPYLINSDNKLVIFDNQLATDTIETQFSNMTSMDNINIVGFTYRWEGDVITINLENETVIDWSTYQINICHFSYGGHLQVLTRPVCTAFSDTLEITAQLPEHPFYFISIISNNNTVYRQAILRTLPDSLDGIYDYGKLNAPLSLTTSSEESSIIDVTINNKEEKWCFWPLDGGRPTTSKYHILSDNIEPGYYGRAYVGQAVLKLRPGTSISPGEELKITVQVSEELRYMETITSEAFIGNDSYLIELVLAFTGYKYKLYEGRERRASMLQRTYLLQHGFRPTSIWYGGEETYGKDLEYLSAYGEWATADFKYLSLWKASGNHQKVHMDISDLNNMGEEGVTQGPVYVSSSTGALNNLYKSNKNRQSIFPIIGKVGVQNSGFLIPTVSENDDYINDVVIERKSNMSEEIKSTAIAGTATAVGLTVAGVSAAVLLGSVGALAVPIVGWGLAAAAAVACAIMWIISLFRKSPIYFETMGLRVFDSSPEANQGKMVLPIWGDANRDVHWPGYLYTHYSDELHWIYYGELMMMALGNHLYYYTESDNTEIYPLDVDNAEKVTANTVTNLTLTIPVASHSYMGIEGVNLQDTLKRVVINAETTVFDNIIFSELTPIIDIPHYWNSAESEEKIVSLNACIKLLQTDNFENSIDRNKVYADYGKFTDEKYKNIQTLLDNTAMMFKVAANTEASIRHIGVDPAYVIMDTEAEKMQGGANLGYVSCLGGAMGFGNSVRENDCSTYYYSKAQQFKPSKSTLLPIANAIKPIPIQFDEYGNITQGNLLSWYTGSADKKQSGWENVVLKQLAVDLSKDCPSTLSVMGGINATRILKAL